MYVFVENKKVSVSHLIHNQGEEEQPARRLTFIVDRYINNSGVDDCKRVHFFREQTSWHIHIIVQSPPSAPLRAACEYMHVIAA